ncbi:MAG: GDSL-type esterase/lipase family protein [Paludibacteraceae bacterium]
MKPSRIAILIWCAIALLGVMCVVLPERIQVGQLTLRWTTLRKVLGGKPENEMQLFPDTLEDTALVTEVQPTIAESKPDTAEAPRKVVPVIPTVEEVQGDSDVLVAFRRGLADSDKRTVRVVYYGDSQIEEDRMTQTLRRKLQTLYGGGGVGLIPLQQTVPTRTVKQTLTINGIRQTTQQGPRRNLVYGPKTQRREDGLYGAMGQVALVGDSAALQQDSVALHVEPMGKKKYSETYFNRVRFWTEGDFRYYVNGMPRMNSAATAFVLADSTVECDLSLVGCGAVYGISLETETGVIVDNIPMRGCTGTVFTDIDSTQLATFYRETNTRLIIMQFGGNAIPFNEQPTTIAGTVQSLRKQVHCLRQCAPEASILFVGPGDMLTQIDGETTTYPLLPYMDKLLRKMAAEEHIAYFSLYEMMGGKDSMLRWQKNGWAGSDGVHFTRRGAEIAGEKLSEYIFNNLKNETPLTTNH